MGSSPILNCLDIKKWREYSRTELLEYLDQMRNSSSTETSTRRGGSVLVVRRRLSPVDVYCYLKARFGQPNGVQTILRKDDSDNLFHWDYYLKAAGEDVHISGTNREIHFMLSEKLTDTDWLNLISTIKSDFERTGREKAAVLETLEKWFVFPNKFVEVADVCAGLHDNVTKDFRGLSSKISSISVAQDDSRELSRLTKKFARLYSNCLELSLITPVLAEAFINMAILILCKKEIRNNKRQLDSFLRSQIDVKIFDLPYKCEGFDREIDAGSEAYKNFKRVMDKRNHAIHGNIDPEGEHIEVVYFEGKRPLFKEAGDHIRKYFEARLRQSAPNTVIKDYECIHEFLYYLVDCLKPSLREGFWRLLEDPAPGFDPSRKIVGALFPHHVVTFHVEGIRYDDELLSTD